MVDKKYKIIISNQAQHMLRAHMRFMAQANKAAAVEVKKDLVAAIRSLQQMPYRFPFFNELYMPPNKYHKMYVPKWYLMLYQVQDDNVYVDYILDCREDYGWLLR